MPSTVLATLPNAMLLVAGELGLDPARLLAEAGLRGDALSDPDGRIPFAAHERLWAAIVAHGSPNIGLELGARLGARALGVVGHAMARAETVRAGLACIDRFRRLVLEDAVPRLTTARGFARFAQPLPPRFARMRHPAEAAAAATLTMIRTLSAENVRAHRVAFQHPQPSDTSAHHALFGASPQFGAAVNELTIDAAVLDRPIVHADPELHAYLVRRAEQLNAELGADDRLADRVRRIVTGALVDGEPTAPVIARGLGVSGRTLHRRLAAEGTNLAKIVDEVRRERALSLVQDPARRIADIAFALGYNDGTTFARAFRRWTGKTPGEFRRR